MPPPDIDNLNIALILVMILMKALVMDLSMSQIQVGFIKQILLPSYELKLWVQIPRKPSKLSPSANAQPALGIAFS